PMLVMFIPMCLLLSQLALWYQARPLRIGEESVVMLRLAGAADAAWPRVQIESTPALDTTIGPVSILSQRAICWNIVPREAGYHRLFFVVGGPEDAKGVGVGEGV